MGEGTLRINRRHPIFDAIDWSTWRARDLATLCFVRRGEEVLLIEKKRGLGEGKINAPGGKADPGETLADCARRETREELGVIPLDLAHHGWLRFQFHDGYALEAHVFVAEDCEGEPIETDEAVPLWTSLDRIPYRRMWADDVLWLPHVLQGMRVEGEFLFEGDRMLGVDLRLTDPPEAPACAS